MSIMYTRSAMFILQMHFYHLLSSSTISNSTDMCAVKMSDSKKCVDERLKVLRENDVFQEGMGERSACDEMMEV